MSQGNLKIKMPCGKDLPEDISCAESGCSEEPTCRYSDTSHDIVYVSLPISGHPISSVRLRVEEARRRLEAMGHTVVTPFDIPDYVENEKWEWYMARCIRLMQTCTAICLLSGHEASMGCRLELAIAELWKLKQISL